MNPDSKLELKRKTKLLFRKDGVTSQIVDYYNRFGQNRDLEQYLTFSNPGAGRQCPSIQSDTTSDFSTVRCLLTDSENHSACLRKEILTNNLTDNDSDDNHTAKYLMKPSEPVGDNREKPSISTTLENEIKKAISIKFDSKTKFAIGDSDTKSDESSHEVISPREDINQNLDSSLNKAGSPTSSITSRKLEWDSLADVGYANVGQNKNPHQNLSTLERIALDGHLKSGNSTKRSDDKKRSTSNETSSQLPNFSQVGLPDAQSTPIQVSQSKLPAVAIKRKSILHSSPHKESFGDSKSGRRASSKERHHKSHASNLNIENLKIDMTKHFSINLDVDQNKRKVASDGNIKYEEHERLPPKDKNRLHSENLEENVLRKLKTKHSGNESTNDSSKSGVLSDAPTSDKEIQTSSRQSVSTAAQTSSRPINNCPIILNVRSNARPVYRTKKKQEQYSTKALNVASGILVHELTESDHTEEVDANLNAMRPLVAEHDDSLLKCGESFLSRAESFEYMPGHMFQNNNDSPLHDILHVEKSIPESSLGTVSPESSRPFMSSSSGLHSKDIELINIETSSCFERDLNANVNFISKFVAQRHNDPELKKKLIKQVVKMLVKADYPGDENSESPRIFEDVSIFSNGDSSNDKSKIKEIPTIAEAAKKMNPPEFDETNILLKRTAFHKQIFIKSKSSGGIFTQTQPEEGIPPKKCQSCPASLAVSSRINKKNSQRSLESKVMCDKSVQLSISGNSTANNSTDKYPVQSYESSSVACSSTSGHSRRILSAQLSEPTKSKSEHIYEQYLIAKKQEDIEKKQYSLKKWTLVKKNQDPKHAKQSMTKRGQISTKDYTSASDTEEITRQLDMINNEIIQLNLLKIKLENKNKPKSSYGDELLSRENPTIELMPNQIVDVYALTKSTRVPENYLKSHNNKVHIPILDLRKSSDESSMNTLSNAEELSLQSASWIQNDPPLLPENTAIFESHQNNMHETETPDEPVRNDVRDVSEAVESPRRIQNDTKLFSRKKSEDLKKVKILYKTDGPETGPQCKCKHSRSHNFQSTTTILKKSCKAQFGSPEKQFGVLCSCCRSNLLSSESSSESNKRSAESQSVSTTVELQKLEKIFAKYQKCKVMKSFMKDYDKLVLKYQKMKEKKIVSNIWDGTDEGNRKMSSANEDVANIGNVHLINLNEKIKKFNEGIPLDEHKIKLLPENNDDRPISAPLLISASSFQKEIEPAVVKNIKITETSQRADIYVSQTVNIEKSAKESPKRLIGEKNGEKPKSVCVDAATSPLVLCSEKTVENLESSRKSLDLTDTFVLKVKKVVMQEYEDLAKKVDRIQDTIQCRRKTSVNSKNISEDINVSVTIEESSASKPPIKSSKNSKSKNCSDNKIIRTDSKKSEISSGRKRLAVDVAKYENISHSEAVRIRGKAKNTNKENEILCLCPKSEILELDLHNCKCQKRIERQKYISKLVKEAKKQTAARIPKPIAYNLILEPSDSILEEVFQKFKRQSIEDVVVKIPKHPGARMKDARDYKTISKSSGKLCNDREEKDSTDEQIKEFSSLNEEFSDKSSVTDYTSEREEGSHSIGSGKESNRPKTHGAKKKSMSVEEYLRVNKPRFIDEADKRRECLRRLHILREQRDAQRRRILSLGVSNLPNIKDISTSDLHQLADQYGITFAHTGKSRIFNSHDMVRNTARQYKKLPEVQNKKQDLKKQQSKKSNLLMADLFAKKLQEKALKGVVNISHSSNVVTI